MFYLFIHNNIILFVLSSILSWFLLGVRHAKVFSTPPVKPRVLPVLAVNVCRDIRRDILNKSCAPLHFPYPLSQCNWQSGAQCMFLMTTTSCDMIAAELNQFMESNVNIYLHCLKCTYLYMYVYIYADHTCEMPSKHCESLRARLLTCTNWKHNVSAIVFMAIRSISTRWLMLYTCVCIFFCLHLSNLATYTLLCESCTSCKRSLQGFYYWCFCLLVFSVIVRHHV